MSPLIVNGAREIEQGSREFSEMYTDTQPKFRTVATAFAAATIYTGLLLTVSTSPARAAAPADRDFVRNVETQIARTEWAPSTKTGVSAGLPASACAYSPSCPRLTTPGPDAIGSGRCIAWNSRLAAQAIATAAARMIHPRIAT